LIRADVAQELFRPPDGLLGCDETRHDAGQTVVRRCNAPAARP
jgi:hypothetical protein